MSSVRQSAIYDFEQARFRADVRQLLARLTRRSEALLSYEDVARQLRLSERREAGLKTIPVASIVGSVGRAADFTRTFLPRRAGDMERWVRVRTAYLEPNGPEIPPIEVYQVGDVYFVLDGNHRVSIARLEGIQYIEARVIEITSPVPLTPDMTPEDLICSAEYAQFLAESGLDDGQDGFQFDCNLCGSYPKLLERIAFHRLVLNLERDQPVTFHQAARDWLENEYAPLVQIIRDQNLLRWFPDRTETDLYLWVVEHQQQLEQELGWQIQPQAVITDLAVRNSPAARAVETETGAWRENRISDRYLQHLFRDILVPLGASEGAWHAFEQALLIAQRENAALHGLHIVRAVQDKNTPPVAALNARFLERCAQASVHGELTIEKGSIANKIRERSLITDLIVLHMAHPPAGALAALTSGWRTLLKQAIRPLLAVPAEPSQMQRALLLFDGTPKSEQALFIAAYMAENWGTALTVLTPEHLPDVQATVRRYLELHELPADYILAQATTRVCLDTLAARNLDLMLLGNDTGSQWTEMRGKSAVSHFLRTSPRPLLICQ